MAEVVESTGVMSSPGGLRQQQQQYSQSDFLARWMPSCSRAGVILNPSSPVLAESLRHGAAWRSSSPPPPPPLRGPNAMMMMGPDDDVNDSFASDFAPLPASPSSSSSCVSVDAAVHPHSSTPAPATTTTQSSERTVCSAGGVQPMPPAAAPRHSFEELLASQTEELPLRMKLEQLRQWQRHMQEQLKAHQLAELRRLQEDQQRLLGSSGSQDCDTSELSGADGEESSVQDGSPCREAAAVFQSPEEDDPEQSFDASSHYEDYDSTLVSHYNGTSVTEGHHRGQQKHSHDRPIKPGIGGQTQTFEELLEEQLRLEDQRLKSAQQQQSQNVAEAARFPPKRAFLRRGEGLSRFTKNNRKAASSSSNGNREMLTEPINPQLRDRVITRRKSEPAMTQKATGTTGTGGSANSGAQRHPPVQRKTAVLNNKENRPRGPCSPPPQEVRTNGKPAWTTKVLGSHQRQNTAEGGAAHSAPLAPTRKPGTRGGGDRRPPPNAVTKEVVAAVVGGGSKCQNGVGAGEDAARGSGSRQRRTKSEGTVQEGDDGGAPDYSFELALRGKLQRWDAARGLESMELGEFELLEEAAEELSFSSNSSFVMKVLQMDQKHRQLLAARGLHQRRLSSTPIKSPRPSPPKALLQRSNSLGSTGSSSGGGGGGGGACKGNTSDSQQANKIAADDDDDGTPGSSSDASFCTNSEFDGEQEVAAPPPAPTFPSNRICFQAAAPPRANLPYDKRSYQDGGGGGSAGLADATEGDHGEAADGSVLSNPGDDSTLTEDDDEDDRRGDGPVFDDDDTWHDVEEEVGGPANDSRGPSPVSVPMTNGTSSPPPPPPERSLRRKVAMNKGAAAGLDKGVVAAGSAVRELDCVVVAPPSSSSSSSSSQLMTRLFPSLKPTQPPLAAPPRPQPAAGAEVGRAEDAPGKHVQSRLRERLVELELEIERFKKENAALTRLRQDNEKLQETLRKERGEFERTKAEEMSRFEEYRKEESRRLQKERRVFERHATTVRAMPDKKEREEIQALKLQLGSVQEELRRQESRWSSTQSRLRQQIDSLSSDNMALREEVRTMEKLRLSTWKKSPSEGEGDKDKREGPSVPATKGVKFASPLDTRASRLPHSSSTAATRGSLRDPSSTATGMMKSSLRKSSAPACLSPGLGRIVEERKRPAASTARTQDKTQSQEPVISNTSPPTLLCEMEQPTTTVSQSESGQELVTHSDGKIEKVLPCGGRLLVFPNGTRKEVSADGQAAKVTFFNGDTKQVMADQRVIYYFAEAQTTHTTYPDGMEILQFPNSQTEKHFPDGHKEITFPDQTVKTLYPDGREESVLTDGTIIHVNPDGTKEIQFNTGQKEVHTAQYKRREYPDGTLKTVYTDGRQETRYPTGRVRIKDKDGHVVLDQIATTTTTTDGHSLPF